jgi:hypothetical protein
MPETRPGLETGTNPNKTGLAFISAERRALERRAVLVFARPNRGRLYTQKTVFIPAILNRFI